jgi:hypothetical protein
MSNFTVRYTRTRIGDVPLIVDDPTRFDTDSDARVFANALTRFDHIIAVEVIRGR